MTREERIDWLCRLRSWVVAPPLMTAEQKSKFIEALTETIKAMQIEPCEDAISRQAVLSEIEAVCFSKRWSKFRADNGSNGERDYLINYIKQMPPVQTEPKTGHWSHDGSHWENRFICSECGYKLFDEPTNYCPNCGCRMM